MHTPLNELATGTMSLLELGWMGLGFSDIGKLSGADLINLGD